MPTATILTSDEMLFDSTDEDGEALSIKVSVERTTVVDLPTGTKITVDGDLESIPPLSAQHRLKVVQSPPKTRADCVDGPRPCPWVTCRYNLYLDVRQDGVLRVNFPDKQPNEMIASCALDMAADGPRTLDQIAALMGMSKERARQIESSALTKLKTALKQRRFDE